MRGAVLPDKPMIGGGGDAMDLRRWVVIGLLAWAGSGAGPVLAQGSEAPPRLKGSDSVIVRPGEILPPRVVPPCAPGACPFAGQRVTVLAVDDLAIGSPLLELKAEFEAATGGTLDVVRRPYGELFSTLMADLTAGTGKFDACIAGAWWLGDLVESNYLLPYDAFHKSPRFPAWDIEQVLPGPRSLLQYGGHKYMVANDHDGQVMYYRRDLLADPKHRAAFQQKHGYPLRVPATWDEFRDVAAYFNGQDLNGDGEPDHGVVLPLRADAQAMFNYMSLSAPFVIGPSNPRLYWFDPATMKPLIDSPGHVRALTVLTGLVKHGPKEMLQWDLGRSWDHFLGGRAALAVTWGDLGALAQQPGSRVRGKVGVAQLPGVREYYDVGQRRWVKTSAPHRVGNTTGGSWAGVISRFSKAPEATYYLLALMASQPKSEVYATRGWDGIDPGRRYHFLPPNGTARIENYVRAGWDADDVRGFLQAYHDTYTNPQQLPYLRIPGAYSYWLALDLRLAEATSGQLSAEAALKAAAVDFEDITIRLGRERQRRSYRASLGF
jgi:multiple sugar transport system substrate-binding protein